MDKLIKTGGSSIVLGSFHYKHFVPIKRGKLLKITKISREQNELKHLDLIRTIKNYSHYYSIPDELSILLSHTDDYYNYLKNILQKDDLLILTGRIHCFYIDNAGDYDLHDTILHLMSENYRFWRSQKIILNFSKQIMEGLNFLHKKKLCHLDIKPENIMVNTITYQFKIIDFGFCSLEPFTDYIYNIKGTAGYIPKYMKNFPITEWLPKVIANDFIEINGIIPVINNRQLVYKIDSYSFGRVLYFLNYMYKENVIYCCYNFEKNNEIKLNNIIMNLTKSNVYKRITIQQCLNKYFN